MRIRDVEVFGAASDSAQSGRAVLIRVNNAAELARSQGALASLAQSLAPVTVESQVYSTLADKLKAALASENVNATVSVVNPVGYTGAKSDLLRDLAVGVAGAGLFELLRYGVRRWRDR